MPRLLVDEPYGVPSGRNIRLHEGGDLQAALDRALPGDAISLDAGAVFRGNFRLPKKSKTGWIVVQSSSGALLPPGVRVSPASAAAMSKLVSPNSAPVILAAPGAKGYRFVGIEFTLAPHVDTARQIIAFGGTQSSLSETPGKLVLDRCYIHGHAAANVFRGVLLNSASSIVINSHISEIHVAGHDSQAILGYNGPGPFKIVNNYLEAAGENIMFGGGDPSVADLVPSDIEIRRNHLFKPLRWRGGESPVRWTVKNLLELKNGRRVLIEGNILENVWVDAQAGTAVVLTPRSNGRAPWTVVEDVIFRNNIVKNAVGGFAAQSTDDRHPTQQLRRIAVVNNLWLSLERTFFTFAATTRPAEDVLIDHNTAVPTGYFSYDFDAPSPPALIRFQFTNNLVGFGRFGVKFPRAPEEVGRWLPGATIKGNALVRMGSVSDGGPAVDTPSWEPAANAYLVLRSASEAGLLADGTLNSRGPLKRAGTDQKDIGIDFGELQHGIGPLSDAWPRSRWEKK
ncbi:MAG TPA: hypothetical protein VGF59_35785 [Bryobacteraceae bacterium]|jgi:hypothetical protein